jgi:hypothetical protein
MEWDNDCFICYRIKIKLLGTFGTFVKNPLFSRILIRYLGFWFIPT